MKKIVRLTERDLTRLVKKVILEEDEEIDSERQVMDANEKFFTDLLMLKDDLPSDIEIDENDLLNDFPGFMIKIDGVSYRYKMDSQKTTYGRSFR